MKVRYLGTLLLAILAFYGCNDNTGALGIDMLPDSDGMSAHTTTFDVITESLYADSVFAKTSTGYVGRFSDKEFGFYEASFLTELNCTDNFTFPDVYKYDPVTKTGTGQLAGDSISSAQLVIFYSSWFGDSLNACRMSVYELEKRLDKNRYTNIQPEEYYNKTSPILLGRKAYTAYDLTVPDSVRNATDVNGNRTFYPNVSFQLDKKMVNEKFLKAYRNHPKSFENSEAFINNIFKGVYIKSDFGDGTILYIDQVALQFEFHLHVLNDTTGVARKKKDGTDSLFYGTRTFFASTKEVIQANKFSNSALIKEIAEKKKGWTYLKSPAGIFTQATMPYDKIYEKLSKDTLNAAKLTFTNYNQESKYDFSMSAPREVLLIRKTDLKKFFEENKLADNITSFTVMHNNMGTNQYTFRNIARLVTTCIKEKQAAKKKAQTEAGKAWSEAKEKEWEEKWMKENKDWDKILLIPVTITYDYSNQNNPTMTGVQNDLKPGYTRLKGGVEGEALKIEVTSTTFGPTSGL